MDRYVIIKTTDGRFQGKEIRVENSEDVVKSISSLYDYDFKEIFNDGNKVMLTNDHIIVVLQIK